MRVLTSVSVGNVYLGEAFTDLTPEEEVALHLWLISHGKYTCA